MYLYSILQNCNCQTDLRCKIIIFKKKINVVVICYLIWAKNIKIVITEVQPIENFATRLLAAIEYRGVSQKWLADNANTTEATISRYVNNKASPSIIVVLRDVASALKVSSDYLIGLTNLPQSKDDIDIEEKTIISVWNRVSDDDKKVFFALLDKYLTSKEKDALRKGE